MKTELEQYGVNPTDELHPGGSMRQLIFCWTVLCVVILALSLSCDDSNNGFGVIAEIDELEARLARLEAKEACVSKFNEYLYYVDGELVDDVFKVFTEDAVLELRNYPPGSGENVTLQGYEQIRPVYKGQIGIRHRHHTMNIGVNVSEDATSAEMSAYFFTVLNHMLTGGIYEAFLENRDGQWYISQLRISSTWGWTVSSEMDPFLDEDFGAGTLGEGRPVLYENL